MPPTNKIAIFPLPTSGEKMSPPTNGSAGLPSAFFNFPSRDNLPANAAAATAQ